MHTHTSSISLSLLVSSLINLVCCNPEQLSFNPGNNAKLSDYESETRFSRSKWIDMKIFAILDKPELFYTGDMLPFGIDGEKKGLIVVWNTDPSSKAYSLSALVNSQSWISWFSTSYDLPSKNAYPSFMHWRFIPITKLHPNTPSTIFTTEYPRENQFWVVNDYLEWSRDPVIINGMRLFTSTKYAMGASEFGDGDMSMLNVKNSGNLRYLRRVIVTRSQESAQWGELTFIPDSAQDLGLEPGSWILYDEPENEERNSADRRGGGVFPLTLVDSTYEGLSNANLTMLTRFPPEDHVIVNVCAAFEYKRGYEDLSKADIGVFHIILSRGEPVPERVISEEDDFPTIEVCSTATLVTKIWPF
ncbi:hypothetical protein TWF481_006884 [Arthrobotrys musiformis]|uniref:Uncharacterized protein n=1 Tax=Arthrobotrys musiformis TaxID=47236 RepID=A0AAV9WBP7_9PEZI